MERWFQEAEDSHTPCQRVGSEENVMLSSKELSGSRPQLPPSPKMGHHETGIHARKSTESDESVRPADIHLLEVFLS